MENIKKRSLEELEQLYREKLEHWQGRRLELLEQAEECERQALAYEEKLRHIRALVNGPQAAAPAPAPAPAPGKRRGKRRRKSPIRDATLLVLRNRPSQKLTAAQIKTAIRKDIHRRGTRQAINVGLNVLAKAGLVKRARAPKGSGAQFVYWAS